MKNSVKSKRIVFVIGSMGRGGAERVISILANDYANRGWNVDIIMLLEDRCEYLLNKNINKIFIFNKNKSRIGNIPKWFFEIRRFIKYNKPDKVVSFVARINIIAILACLGMNQHITISERNDPNSDGRSIIIRFLTYILYPLANCIVFQTRWAQSCFPKKIQFKSTIIANPVQVNAKASFIKNKRIVAVGRLIEQKNHAMLIQAFKSVHKLYPEYELYIYGEGKLRKSLQKQIEEIELSGYVFLPGSVINVHEKIADAEIFVLSSNYEGLSNSLLEAMMLGLPCISTNCAGSNEIIVNGYNGILVEVGDEVQLAKSIVNLITGKVDAKLIGENGKRSVQYMSVKNIISLWRLYIES